MDSDFQVAKDLYYLTCEMHAELWRLERMAQAYPRSEILRLKTGELSRQVQRALDRSKPYIAQEVELSSELLRELDCAAGALCAELLRVDERRQRDLRVADFGVEERLFARMKEVRARMEELLVYVTAGAGTEPGTPSALNSFPLWAVTSSLNPRLAENNV